MPPSKIISIGATAIVLGIIGQATVFWMLYNLASQGSSESAERFDTIIVEQSGFGFNAVTVSLGSWSSEWSCFCGAVTGVPGSPSVLLRS